MGRKSNNPFQIHFGLKFYLQKSGYWMNRTKERCLLAHRWVWQNSHGLISEGMDIHHIDGDKSNNCIENLAILNRSDHRKEHWNDENLKPICLDQLNKVRPMAWLKSGEGKKAISDKGKEVWKNRKPHKIICEQCNGIAEFKRWARFCSKKCYMAWRWRNVIKPSSCNN